MLSILFPVVYVLLCVLVAKLLDNRNGGFYLMLILSLLFTPLVVGFVGILFSKADQE